MAVWLSGKNIAVAYALEFYDRVPSDDSEVRRIHSDKDASITILGKLNGKHHSLIFR